MSFAVFLDVDGVLNTIKTCVASPDGHIGVDDRQSLPVPSKSMAVQTLY